MENIKVIARLRPSILNNDKFFKKEGNRIKILKKEQDYCFDEIYDENNNNENIFNKTVKNYINSSLKGYNYTLFAYGQTGSGKTHTMLGPKSNKLDKNDILGNYNGVLIYYLIHLFNKIKEDNNSSYFVKCSYLEIYNEYIYDLLDENKERKPLLIHENKNKEFKVKGLKEEDISSVEEALFYLKKGETLRKYSESLLKHQSSRSHTILKIKIKKIKNNIVEKARRFTDDKIIIENNKNYKKTKNNDSKVTESLINFIDLAGSERTFNSNKQDNYKNIDNEEELKEKAKSLMKEGKYNNKSLFFLTRIISLLSNKKYKNIPFKDSTLTKILKNSLGGNSKTTIILNLHNDKNFVGEGISTLRFGINAKKIVNRVEANILTQNNNQSLQILVRNYENKILLLKNSISDYHNKNIKLSCIVDKILLEKLNIEKKIKDYNNEDKSISNSQKKLYKIDNNEKIRNMILDSQNIIELQNEIIKKLFHFNKIYLDKIKIISNEYQDEFVFSNEQKLKLLFFEKLEGFTMMTDKDLIKMEDYLKSFENKLNQEKNRRNELLNIENNKETLDNLNLFAIKEKKKKDDILKYFEEKFNTFIFLKNNCNNELKNLENMINEHKNIMKIDDFLKSIKEYNINNQLEIEQNKELLKNMIDKFQSKFDKKNEEFNYENEELNSKKKLFKIQSYEIGNSIFKSNLNKKEKIDDWKLINEEKKNLWINKQNKKFNLNYEVIIKEDKDVKEDENNIENNKNTKILYHNKKKVKIDIKTKDENNKKSSNKNLNITKKVNNNNKSYYLGKKVENKNYSSFYKTLPNFSNQNSKKQNLNKQNTHKKLKINNENLKNQLKKI